jgi:hypothetical protein
VVWVNNTGLIAFFISCVSVFLFLLTLGKPLH